MAVAITFPVAVVASTTNVATYSWTAFTPTANSLLLVFLSCTGTAVPAVVSGGGLTWIEIYNVTVSTSRTIACFYAQVGASPVSTTIQAAFTGDSGTGFGGAAFQVTGHNASNPIAQSKIVTGASGANPTTGTLDLTTNTLNGYMLFFGNGNNPPAGTPPTGWTEDADTGFATPTTGVYACHRAGGETANSFTVTSASVGSPYDLMFVEVNEATQGTVTKKSMLTLLGVGANRKQNLFSNLKAA